MIGLNLRDEKGVNKEGGRGLTFRNKSCGMGRLCVIFEVAESSVLE